MNPMLLTRHPQTPSDPTNLRVIFGRTEGLLRVTFRIRGDTSEILLPDKAEMEFRDELWRHTCFEVFVMPREGPHYAEINLSPSTEWAAYRFDDYREGMRRASIDPARIVRTSSKNRFELSAAILLPEWAEYDWRLNLTAVIEEKGGRKSYWALAHGEGPPDFHNADCFTAHLPPVETP
jgi:hypothetical protein